MHTVLNSCDVEHITVFRILFLMVPMISICRNMLAAETGHAAYVSKTLLTGASTWVYERDPDQASAPEVSALTRSSDE